MDFIAGATFLFTSDLTTPEVFFAISLMGLCGFFSLMMVPSLEEKTTKGVNVQQIMDLLV